MQIDNNIKEINERIDGLKIFMLDLVRKTNPKGYQSLLNKSIEENGGENPPSLLSITPNDKD